MAGAQVSGGYSPPIGGFWGDLPVLSQINEGADLLNNPNANVAHDVTGIASLAVPGFGGLGLGLLSSALPGGWLNSVLFGNPGLTGDALAAETGSNLGGGLGTPLADFGKGSSPGLLSEVGDAIGSGISSIAQALGLESGSSDNQGIGQKFGG